MKNPFKRLPAFCLIAAAATGVIQAQVTATVTADLNQPKAPVSPTLYVSLRLDRHSQLVPRRERKIHSKNKC